jgi:hypothetical protein
MNSMDIADRIRSILTASRVPETKNEIGIQEAYILWQLLENKYTIIDQLNLIKNFSHDQDFVHIVNKYIEAYQRESNMLEKIMGDFSIPGPPPGTRDLSAIGSSETMKDKSSAMLLYGYQKLNIGYLMTSIKDARTNDNIRKILLEFTSKALSKYDDYIKYLKLKGWANHPPLYQYIKPNVKEKVAVNEIFLLWDHLVFRYANIKQTEIFIEFTNDLDFKFLLDYGVKILLKQCNSIEDKLLEFGITLPNKYTPITPNPGSTETMEDNYIFNIVLLGMQNATVLHGTAIQEIIVNDSIRSFFIKLTLEEIDFIDKMLKYGKIKGWLQAPPKYKLGQ